MKAQRYYLFFMKLLDVMTCERRTVRMMGMEVIMPGFRDNPYPCPALPCDSEHMATQLEVMTRLRDLREELADCYDVR